MVKLKIKKLTPEAKIPEYAKEGDACMDVYATSKEEKEKYVQYGTGLAFELPERHAMLVFPRSSVTKRDMMLKNSVGVLDSGYRGELKLRFNKTQYENTDIYETGEKIGQIMIIPLPEVEVEEVEELEDSSRGEGGFGSTGTH